MHGPPLVGWLLVALSAAVGAYCLLCLRGEPPGRRRRALGGEALMAWGMALMAVPHTALDPMPWAPPAFAAVFGAAAGWALLSAARRRPGPPGHHLHHGVGALAMVYMALAMAEDAGAHGHAGHAAGRVPGGEPLLTGVLLAYFAAYALRAGVRLVPLAGGAGTGPARSCPPGAAQGRAAGDELEHACRVAMGVGMAAMLLTL
ncbi:DUF5134 domain-containing protein [Streptomyces sp. B1866]|uniref:DUF5134 domain-containing protein n=1 Tax=Streptomyces sp. B1866 TaxID=3075431 RepID=UPI00288EC2D0|nr:DUF5134 domain-containing protein [Streptomyces sp. B1866]MDT3399171.1 DUF5134 domain-containing protein [Streptomyces sp. B1866]